METSSPTQINLPKPNNVYKKCRLCILSNHRISQPNDAFPEKHIQYKISVWSDTKTALPAITIPDTERTDQATHEQDKNETEKRHIKLHLKGKGS